MKYKLDKNRIKTENKANNRSSYTPKTYVAPLINQVNEWARATRPETIGEIASDVFPRYIVESTKHSVNEWKEYFLRTHINEYNLAFQKLKNKYQEVKTNFDAITDDDLRDWLDDFLFIKTFNGLFYQVGILNDIADRLGKELVLPTAKDESMGIDGYIDGRAYSVKPFSYMHTQAMQHEKIDAVMVYYDDSNKEYIEYEVMEEPNELHS